MSECMPNACGQQWPQLELGSHTPTQCSCFLEFMVAPGRITSSTVTVSMEAPEAKEQKQPILTSLCKLILIECNNCLRKGILHNFACLHGACLIEACMKAKQDMMHATTWVREGNGGYTRYQDKQLQKDRLITIMKVVRTRKPISCCTAPMMNIFTGFEFLRNK